MAWSAWVPGGYEGIFVSLSLSSDHNLLSCRSRELFHANGIFFGTLHLCCSGTMTRSFRSLQFIAFTNSPSYHRHTLPSKGLCWRSLSFNRTFSTTVKPVQNPYYVTTPIFYVNAGQFCAADISGVILIIQQLRTWGTCTRSF